MIAMLPAGEIALKGTGKIDQYPADRRRNNNVIITSKRRRFDVIMALLFRRVPVGVTLSNHSKAQQSAARVVGSSITTHGMQVKIQSPGIILVMGSANERRRYLVTPPLIGCAHSQNDP